MAERELRGISVSSPYRNRASCVIHASGLITKENVMNRLEKVQYTAKAHTTGGRAGMSRSSDDGRLEVRPSRPGSPGAGTNPERLFAAAGPRALSRRWSLPRNMKIASRSRGQSRDRSRSRRGRLQPGGSPLREPAGDGARDGVPPCRCGPPGVSLFASNAGEHRRRNDAGLRPLR
jgi:hypothetical protein